MFFFILVDGGWGDWSEWSKCSGYCGEGERTRSRNCDSPAPAYEGDDCEGDDSETETCKHYVPCKLSKHLFVQIELIFEHSSKWFKPDNHRRNLESLHRKVI